MTASWPVELWRAVRELRTTSRGYTQFVESRAAVVPAGQVMQHVSVPSNNAAPIALDPAGERALGRVFASSGNAQRRLDLELWVARCERGETPTVLVMFDGTDIGRVEDPADLLLAAAQAGNAAALSLDGGQLPATGTLYTRPGQQPPFALEIELPVHDQ